MAGAGIKGGNRRLLIAVALSLILHIVIAVLLLRAEVPTVPVERETVRLRVLDRVATAEKTKKAPVEKLEGQVVDVPAPQREEVPDSAKFLSNYNTKVEREVKARRRPSGERRAGAPGPTGRQAIKADGEQALKRPEMKDSKATVDQAESGAPAPKVKDDALRPGNEKLLKGMEMMLVPSLTGSGRGGLHNMQALGGIGGNGQGGSAGMVFQDALMGVPEEGDLTLVNSRKFKYFEYFQRMKDAIRGTWLPSERYRARDPYGKVYGDRDRLTILAVVLNSKGAVTRIDVLQGSGLEFLDDEAVRAFREAGPFPNPPAGLIDDRGQIAFSFGFLLELGQSRARTFWNSGNW